MRETMSQLDIIATDQNLSTKNGLPSDDVLGQRGQMESQTLPRLLVTLHSLMVRLYCWRQYLFMSLNRKKSRRCPPRSLTLLSSDHSAGKYYMHYQRRKVVLSLTQLQTLQLPTETCSKDTHRCTHILRVTNHFLVAFKVHSVKWNPYPTLLKWPKT